MDKNKATTARKLASAAILVLVLFTAEIARPTATTTTRPAAVTTTERI